MFIAFVLALSSVWTAVVVDLIAESASSGGTQLSLLGHVVFRPTSTGSAIVILASLAASAALGMSTVISSWRRRRLARRMTEQGDRRIEALAQEQANSATRKDLLEWRTLELQHSLDALSMKRDTLLAEIATMQGRSTVSAMHARTEPEPLRPAPEIAVSPTLVAVPDIGFEERPADRGPVSSNGHPSRNGDSTL